MLEDGRLLASSKVSSKDMYFTRINISVDTTSAESIYHQIIDLYLQHASIKKLVQSVRSEVAPCLRGDKEGMQVLFSDRETKKTPEKMHESSPLRRTPTLVLGGFLKQALTNAMGGGNFRILEVGAGTAGTTRYIVKHLR